MLNAMEARKQAETNLDTSMTAELLRVEKLIDEAVGKGSCFVCLEGTLDWATENKLKSLGYRLEVGGRYNERNTRIEW